MVRVFWRSFQVALAMLTSLPAPALASFSAEERGRGLVWFPIIGGLMGSVLVATAWGLLRGVEPILASVILLTVWLFISELRHLDALAHCVSSWMLPKREGQEEVTPATDNLGVMGVIALIMMMKFSALSVLLEYDALIYVLLAPILARLLVVAMIGFTPVASDAILAQEFRIEFPYLALLVWLLMAVPLALVVGVPMFVMFVALLLIRFRMVQRSGGMTWEGIGASIVLLETLGLFAAALLS